MFERDGHDSCYERLKPYIEKALTSHGATAEVGLRRAGTTKLILDKQIETGLRKPHICIDPYGQIPYSVNERIHDTDYSNQMRNETLAELYSFCRDNQLDLHFFNMEDSEFYKRFPDYVPVYEREKIEIDSYCFVHIDGQHSYEAVLPAAQYFLPRMSKNSYIAFDNTDTYDHQRVEREVSDFERFTLVDLFENCGRAVYKRAQ